ncbi:MAG: hypothetical protein JWQ54_2891 [Mucilaginibacter sp.]|nr:hypothetical protein [Mucilaginibacter sp.]
MARLFFNYYFSVTKYNLLFCIFFAIVRSLTTNLWADITEAIILFGTFGVLISFMAYKYFQSIEYCFYINAGLSIRYLQLKTFIINLAASSFILLIWSISYR